MNLVTPAVALVIGLAALAIVAALGRVPFRLLLTRPAPAGRPSLALPYRCPRCRRRDFEPCRDTAGSRPPARLTRCRNCGAWLESRGLGGWCEVSGEEADDPTPDPSAPARLTIRRVMIGIALTAVPLAVSSGMARHARAAGQPLTATDWLFWTSAPAFAAWMAYATWSGARELPPPGSDSVTSWILWINFILNIILFSFITILCAVALML